MANNKKKVRFKSEPIKLNMDAFYEEFRAVKELQEVGISAMIYSIISEPQNNTGYTYDKDALVKKAIFGKYYNTFVAKMFIIASYSANELGELMVNELNFCGSFSYMYQQMFEMLDDVEICDGVVFHL